MIPPASSFGQGVYDDLRWTWRGVRTRGWRAAFIVTLLGVALAANAIVFAAADAFVFRPVPYDRPDTLAIIEWVDRDVTDFSRPAAFREWRKQRDLFADLQAHVGGGSAYLTTGGVTDTVYGERVTPGLFAMLGVMPVWGRPFTNEDAAPGTANPALVSQSLARRLFGDPRSAPGQTFSTGRETLSVVGVMPASFRFPTAREEFWRPLDLSSWPDNSGIRDIARLAPGQTIASAAKAVADRSPAVLSALPQHSATETMRLRAMADVRGNPGARSIFMMLVGAAACVLLIACANVASLEMAAAAMRMRVYAVQSALGASRASLVRVGLFEGAVLLGASGLLAVLLTVWGVGALDSELTTSMRAALINPLDIDARVLGFMLLIATVTWCLTSLPVIRRVSRSSVVDALRDDPRTTAATRAVARSRQLLMIGQIALTTLLLVCAMLYLRTYAARLGVDKGFDAANIATIQISTAPDALIKGANLESEVLARLRVAPGVSAVSRTNDPPPSTQSGITARLTVEGREATAERLMLHFVNVDSDYFQTMRIPIVQGAAFDAATPLDQIVVDERFARAYWPGGSALGARFRMQSAGISGVTSFQIAGISRLLEADRVQTDAGEQVFIAYMRIAPTYNPLSFVARVDSEGRLGEIGALVRSIAPRSVVRVDTVRARYNRLAGDTKLAAASTSAFGVIALIVAAGGIYAVMAFVVAARGREIAIRMALGADRVGTRRMILRSSLTLAAVGAGVGLAAAWLVTRWISTQLFGVARTDPVTYSAVLALVLTIAFAATWSPARRAANVDPAVTLRSQ
ncbi:MAG TPA: ABC transporter permease [Vicinamibacterales bacterium]|nr:ABC transporter permease [Vicinamibacterales bacterium]